MAILIFSIKVHVFGYKHNKKSWRVIFVPVRNYLKPDLVKAKQKRYFINLQIDLALVYYNARMFFRQIEIMRS